MSTNDLSLDNPEWPVTANESSIQQFVEDLKSSPESKIRKRNDVYLNIKGFIAVDIEDRTYEVKYGENITIKCNISASPKTESVKWQKNRNGVKTDIKADDRKYFVSNLEYPSLTIVNDGETDIANTDDSKYRISCWRNLSSLSIVNADETDEAVYTCLAKNDSGCHSDYTYLFVRKGFIVVDLVDKKHEVKYGENITIECSISALPYATSVKWQKNRNGVQTDIIANKDDSKYRISVWRNPYSLTIVNADETDEAVYTCLAKNEFGSHSDYTYLFVKKGFIAVHIVNKIYEVKYGETITIKCNISASPNATSVKWQKIRNGVTTDIEANTDDNKYCGSELAYPSLIIINADDTDEAIYTCFAENDYGRDGDNTSLSVKIGELSIRILKKSYIGHKHDSVVLECVASGNPPPEAVYWLKEKDRKIIEIRKETNNSKYHVSNLPSLSLRIRRIDDSDSGKYTCIAVYSKGEYRSKPMTMSVFGGNV
ncbi:TTN [Mytilus coruscus]|uniref:TTN n=1 Tax=Mytilus coruscus TaxID=42192 RepID=A0A6J8BX86_MYTCO|nr:TTN [Mytilus coruscus]